MRFGNLFRLGRWAVFVPIVVGLLLPAARLAADEFRISDIRLDGLQRISAGTVFNYLPVKIGDTVAEDVTPQLIRALYQTGFFQDVRVEREGTVLVIFVQERPSIASIEITGNSEIKTEDLKRALKDIGLADGRVFDRSVLDRIEQELRRQYFALGKYGVEITSTVSPLERNRVAVKINIVEGLTARIKQINIIGNKAFTEKELAEQLQLGPTRWYSFYSKNDRYSKQKLAGDLEKLRSFYLDRGYIKFDIKSTQVSISPDKKDMYVTVVVEEGEVYTISDLKLAGDLVMPADEIFPMIRMSRDDPFSRKATTESSERISKLLGNNGYAFANVNTIPEIDDANHKVVVTFFVDPGKRVYVRRVNIKGNTKTRDEVLRREMRQMESSWFSTEAVKRSRERLQRLGYFEEVNIETPAVAGSADEMDVNVKVQEKQSGALMAGIGFSQSQGILFNTSITQNNVFGTGKRVVFAFDNSQANRNYRLAYDNPYYTVDGISRGFDLGYRKTNYGDLDVADYLTDVATAGVTFGIPITDTSRVGLGLAYQYTDFSAGDSLISKVFEEENGSKFNDFNLTLTWTNDTRDTSVFPTRGALQTFNALVTIPGSDLEYYRLTYRHRRYFPLAKDFVLMANGDVGYGAGYGNTSAMPFWNNFYAGGPRTVRGWVENTLGPRERGANDDPVGGNMRLVGNLELFAPPPIGGDFQKSLRIGAFFDIGNVWYTKSESTDIVSPIGISLSDLRYSAGVSATWLSPVGVIAVSLAYPINPKGGDDTQFFQFSLGQLF